MIIPTKLGVICDPPALILIYKLISKDGQIKRHRRKIPLRKFNNSSDIVEYLEVNILPRHSEFLESVPNKILEQLMKIIQLVQKGKTVDEAVKVSQTDEEFKTKKANANADTDDKDKVTTVTSDEKLLQKIHDELQQDTNEHDEEDNSSTDEEGAEQSKNSRSQVYEKHSGSDNDIELEHQEQDKDGQDHLDDESISISFSISLPKKSMKDGLSTGSRDTGDSSFPTPVTIIKGHSAADSSNKITPVASAAPTSNSSEAESKTAETEQNDYDNLSLFELVMQEEVKKKRAKAIEVEFQESNTDKKTSAFPKLNLFTSPSTRTSHVVANADSELTPSSVSDKNSTFTVTRTPTSIPSVAIQQTDQSESMLKQDLNDSKRLNKQLSNIFSFSNRKPFLSSSFIPESRTPLVPFNSDNNDKNRGHSGSETSSEGFSDDEQKDFVDSDIQSQGPGESYQFLKSISKPDNQLNILSIGKDDNHVKETVTLTATDGDTKIVSKSISNQFEFKTEHLQRAKQSIDEESRPGIDEQKMETSNQLLKTAVEDDDFFW